MSKDPIYLERLAIEKPTVQLEFNIEYQLRNICVKIALLQALRYIPIYAKMVKDIFLKKLRRKRKEPSTIHFIRKVVELRFGKKFVDKYEDLRNPIVSIVLEVSLSLTPSLTWGKQLTS